MDTETTNQATPLICIACPIGCSLLATLTGDPSEPIKVEGNRCRIGLDHATKEMTNPRRVLTTSVKVHTTPEPTSPYQMLSVKTAGDIPKGLVIDCLKAIKALHLTGHYNVGDTILVNVLDTGTDIIATRAV